MSHRWPPLLGAAALTLAVTACGSDDELTVGDDVSPGTNPSPDVSADPGADPDAGAGNGPTVPIRIYGTTPAPALPDLVAADARCGTDTADEPGFEIVDVQLPPAWEAVGSGGDSLRFATDGAERTLSVGLGQHADGVNVGDVLTAMFGGTTEQVGSIEWGTSSYPVVFDGVTYGVAAFAGEIDNFLGQNVDFVFEARFGGSGSGDTTLFGQDTVLAVFESFALDACAFDDYIGAVSNPDVTIID